MTGDVEQLSDSWGRASLGPTHHRVWRARLSLAGRPAGPAWHRSAVPTCTSELPSGRSMVGAAKRTGPYFVPIRTNRIRPEELSRMKNRVIPTIVAAISIVALSATAVLGAQPPGAGDHGAAVSAVAKAHDALTGRAHGAAVSALAKTHGAEVSAAAKAKGAANAAAGKAKGAAASAAGKAKGAEAAAAGKAKGAAASEPGRLKAAAARANQP